MRDNSQCDAWGRVLSVKDASGNELTSDLGLPTSGIGNRYLFQGREYDADTGLYYFRARWYNPVSGRWLSKDPIGIAGGLNQYAFCGNNSVNFTDPFGQNILKDFLARAFGGAAWFLRGILAPTPLGDATLCGNGIHDGNPCSRCGWFTDPINENSEEEDDT